jgi:TonB family protein
MIVALLAAAAVVVGPAPQNVVQRPQERHWLERPTANDLAAVYPVHAQRAEISGSAELECQFAADGRLDPCRVFAEAPDREGFGVAALALSRRFRIELSAEPASVVSSTIYVPIHFQIVGPGGISLPKQTVLNTPRWTSAPSFDDLANAYPAGAKASAGDVVLRCGVEANGALAACRTLEERPPQQGFADAARSLTSRFRVDFGARAAQSKDDFVADVNVHFVDTKSDPSRDRSIAPPTWLTLYDPDQAAALFPPAAAAKGLRTGRGIVNCEVAQDGGLHDCNLEAGDPDGLGFSEAALKVASGMRMNLWTAGGGPVVGARVTIPIRFDRPEAKRAEATPR